MLSHTLSQALAHTRTHLTYRTSHTHAAPRSSSPAYSGEFCIRLATSLNLTEEGGDKVLEIVTAAKALRIKASLDEIFMWQLRLQEILMLAERVSNVAHGWLLMEVGVKKFSRFWFVLFSNGHLMYFVDQESAVLGQVQKRRAATPQP